jgi:hypothetical protein
MLDFKRLNLIGILILSVVASAGSIVAQRGGNAVMWSPVRVESRDLYNGAGGTAMRPDVRRVTFIKEDTGGNNLKYRIKDARGREWVAKIADESQPEVAANRLLWAIGYRTEIDYVVPRLTIPGKGTYNNVRLEARPNGVDRDAKWQWDENPFVDTREFKGLRVMMAMINNWDLKDTNNTVLRQGRQAQYVVSDLGSSFGSLPVSSAFLLNRFGRSVNVPADYAESKFLHGIEENGKVDFYYKAKGKDLLKGIGVEDARWVGLLLSRLSDRQLRDAFRAANYSPANQRLLAGVVRSRINQLVRLPRFAEARR